MRALVIDDSQTIRSALRTMLRQLGFEVYEAGDGREAWERLRQVEGIKLALVDWYMPEMDGIDFIRTVRAEHAYDGVLLMMVTAQTEQEQVAQALQAGADEYLMKPFTKDIIVSKLNLLHIPHE